MTCQHFTQLKKFLWGYPHRSLPLKHSKNWPPKCLKDKRSITLCAIVSMFSRCSLLQHVVQHWGGFPCYWMPIPRNGTEALYFFLQPDVYGSFVNAKCLTKWINCKILIQFLYLLCQKFVQQFCLALVCSCSPFPLTHFRHILLPKKVNNKKLLTCYVFWGKSKINSIFEPSRIVGSVKWFNFQTSP